MIFENSVISNAFMLPYNSNLDVIPHELCVQDAISTYYLSNLLNLIHRLLKLNCYYFYKREKLTEQKYDSKKTKND